MVSRERKQLAVLARDWSLPLDLALRNHLAPLRRLALDEGLQLGGAGSARLAAEVDEALVAVGAVERFAHLGVDALDDRRGRAAGRPEGDEGDHLVARQRLVHRRHFGERLPAT